MSLTTIAVLLIATAPDSARAVCQGMRQMVGAITAKASEPTVATTMVSKTCISPRPKTWRRMARSLERLNSSPMTNIRNTTPNSPR